MWFPCLGIFFLVIGLGPFLPLKPDEVLRLVHFVISLRIEKAELNRILIVDLLLLFIFLGF